MATLNTEIEAVGQPEAIEIRCECGNELTVKSTDGMRYGFDGRLIMIVMVEACEDCVEKAEAQLRHDPDAQLGSSTLAIEDVEYVCPVCGYKECMLGLEIPGVSVSVNDPELDGVYCLRCWVRKTVEGVPRMIESGEEG